MSRSNRCKTLEDVNEIKQLSLLLLLQNEIFTQETTDLVAKINDDPELKLTASHRLRLVMMVGGHLRPDPDVVQLQSQITTLEDKTNYPRELYGRFLDLHSQLKTAAGLYFQISAKASKAYGITAEASSILLYNKLHTIKLEPNSTLVEKVLKLPNTAPDILLRGIIDARLGENIVEGKAPHGPLP